MRTCWGKTRKKKKIVGRLLFSNSWKTEINIKTSILGGFKSQLIQSAAFMLDSWSKGLWSESADWVRYCRVFLCACLALLYSKTPTNTIKVPAADNSVMGLPNTMMLSQMDKACFTVLATLRKKDDTKRLVYKKWTLYALSCCKNYVYTTALLNSCIWLVRR